MSDQTDILLKSLMDACATRQSVLANNVANANTPGFTRSDLEFKTAMSNALKAGDSEALARFRPQVREDLSSRARQDGNNVSIQKELGNMAQNRLLYDISALALSAKYSRLRAVIKGQ